MSDGSPLKWFHLTTHHQWFYFEAFGSEVHVILSSEFADATSAYHVYIGSNHNTQCSLWKQSVLLQSVVALSLLSNEDPRDFWLSWYQGRIQFGIGKFRTVESVLLDYQDAIPITVTAMALQNVNSSSTAFFRIWDNTALELWSTTNNGDGSALSYAVHLWRSTRHKSWTVLALRACSRVNIMLTAIIHSVDNEYSYSLELQDQENKTALYTWRGSHKLLLAQVNSGDLLSCNEERFYWLSWLRGHIAFGRGLVPGQHPVIAYVDLNPFTVAALAFKSMSNEPATWRMPLGQDEFPYRPDRRGSTALTGGDIAGVVIGSLLLVALIVALAYIALRPTAFIQSCLYSVPVGSINTGSPPSSTTTRQAIGASNNISYFSNPLDEYAEVQIKD